MSNFDLQIRILQSLGSEEHKIADQIIIEFVID
jgi:hypothetical protein